jgi:type II secretory pathway predicted ATPase ExeA
MYLAHWNLREEPFQNVTDSRFAYLSDQHQEGLARLIYLAKGRKLGGALIGPYGVGKSMVLELLAQNVSTIPNTRFVRFDVPPGGAVGLARQVFWSLETGRAFEDVATVLETVRGLIANPKSGFQHTVLAIDEAQLIRESDSLDFLHLLTNFRLTGRPDHPDSPAFTLILAGHEQLGQLVSRETALRQRLSMIWHLEPLNERQTIEYVESRMRAAGGDIWVFEEDALAEVAVASGGIPRVINNMCDVALMMGFAMKATKISRPIVLQAIEEVRQPMSIGGGTDAQGGDTR